MSFREHIVVRILLLLARMFSDNPEVSAELKTLATHIAVNAPKMPKAA